MNRVRIIERSDARRADAERFIRDVYACEYEAHIGQLADRLICRWGPDGEILCVAGLRLVESGFFSEQYLAEPIEAALGRATGHDVRRDEIFEVTTLASRSPRDIAGFIDDIIATGVGYGLSWSFFTLTRRLSLLIQRLHIAPIYLADADPGRVADAASWGRYYETDPKVYGACGVELLTPLVPRVREARHASVL